MSNQEVSEILKFCGLKAGHDKSLYLEVDGGLTAEAYSRIKKLLLESGYKTSEVFSTDAHDKKPFYVRDNSNPVGSSGPYGLPDMIDIRPAGIYILKKLGFNDFGYGTIEINKHSYTESDYNRDIADGKPAGNNFEEKFSRMVTKDSDYITLMKKAFDAGNILEDRGEVEFLSNKVLQLAEAPGRYKAYQNENGFDLIYAANELLNQGRKKHADRLFAIFSDKVAQGDEGLISTVRNLLPNIGERAPQKGGYYDLLLKLVDTHHIKQGYDTRALIELGEAARSVSGKEDAEALQKLYKKISPDFPAEPDSVTHATLESIRRARTAIETSVAKYSGPKI